MPVIWLIGDSRITRTAVLGRAVFRYERRIIRFRTPGEAIRSNADPADVLIVLQVRPREFSQRDCEVLLGSAPLARFVVGLGPWCASHHRSERVWPEAITVPLSELAARVAGELEALSAGGPPLPLTAGRDEAILARYDPPGPLTT